MGVVGEEQEQGRGVNYLKRERERESVCVRRDRERNKVGKRRKAINPFINT